MFHLLKSYEVLFCSLKEVYFGKVKLGRKRTKKEGVENNVYLSSWLIFELLWREDQDQKLTELFYLRTTFQARGDPRS